MPYEWDTTDPQKVTLSAWPYRSLLKRDFSRFVLASCVMFLLPLLAVLGSPILWILLAFFALTIAAIIYAIQRNYKDGRILETLTITKRQMTLTHAPANGPAQTWNAQTYWVRVNLKPKGGPVEDYLTLLGNNREVELGQFLSAEERVTLCAELKQVLAGFK